MAVVVDATSLERNLYLVAVLLALPVPLVLGLNRIDLAKEQGFQIEAHVLEAALGLPVVPMVASRGEGVQNFNGRWQAKVWHRFHHGSLRALQARSAAYIAAARQRGTARAAEAPARRRLPAAWQFDPTLPPCGRLIYLRRTDDHGGVSLLGHVFPVDRHWLHRLVRAEVTLPGGPLRCFALRRRTPESQPLLREAHYELPERRRAVGR